MQDWAICLSPTPAVGPGGVECEVELVISDAHPGLKNTITTLFAGAGWQHCCTHHRQ